jgi:hypothetical protein
MLTNLQAEKTLREEIINQLMRADAVVVGDSPMLDFFPFMGDEDGNLIFTWTEHTGEKVAIIIPEKNLDDATLKEDGYHLKDSKGEEVALAAYLLQPLWKKE